MDDKFLNEMRREPRPEFERDLRAKLQRQGPASRTLGSVVPAFRWNAAAALAALLAVTVMFAFPSVRASAQAFLDLFRVRTFTAVSVNADRMKRLDSEQLDLRHMLGDQIETVKKPGAPQSFVTPGEAAAAAGVSVGVPAMLPRGVALAGRVEVRGEAEARVTVNAEKINRVMDELDVRDLRVPVSLNGQTATVRMPPAVVMTYSRGADTVCFMQARSPEVSLPAGVDLPTLGEIGLRIIGMERDEAHRLARTVDWHSTILVPVPANASSFREVDVHGAKGLMIETTGERQAEREPRYRRRAGSVLLWSQGEKVYAIVGRLSSVDLIQMANSIH